MKPNDPRLDKLPSRLADVAERYLRGDHPRLIAKEREVTLRTVERYLKQIEKAIPEFKLRMEDALRREWGRAAWPVSTGEHPSEV